MILGDYELGPQVGTGGMGAVHLAHEVQTRTPVAVKRIHLQYADEKTTLRRFQIEIQTASRLWHPNIVPVIDCGMEPRGTPYCVMDWVSGMPLVKWIRAKLPWEHIAWIMSDLLSALAYAHARGVVHRDLKPANILVEDPFGSNPQVRLVDFGIARLLEPGDDAVVVTALTMNDRVLGTPAYLSPEQAQGFTHLIGPQTDLYSMGIILWELIAGKLPFADPSVVALLTAHATKKPPPLNLSDRPDVPREVLGALGEILEKSPDLRQRSAHTARELMGIPENPPRMALPKVDQDEGEPTEDIAPTVVDTRSDLLTPTLSTRRPATIEQRWTHEPAVMLGRETEFECLLELARLVKHDKHSRLVFVHGDAGVGKSRLAQEVRYRLEERGVFRGARLFCRSSGQEGEAVRGLLGRLLMAERLTGTALMRRLKDVASLYDLTPIHIRALSTWLGEEAQDAADITDRVDLAAEVLRRIASRGSLSLILEGADEESSNFTLAVLENLFGDLGKSALLFVIATSRTPPLRLSGAMGELYELLSAEGRAFDIDLGPLAQEVLADLLRPVVPEQAEEIARRAAGNPLFAIELARLRSGLSKEDQSLTLPQSMGAVWERRMESALAEAAEPDLCRCLLLATALLGPAAPKSRVVATVTAATNVPIERVDAALATWIEHEVLIEDGARSPSIRFLHNSTADFVVERPDASIKEIVALIRFLADDTLRRRGGLDPEAIQRLVGLVDGDDTHRRRSLRLLAGELFVGRLEYPKAHEQFDQVMDEGSDDGLGLMAALQSAGLFILQGELTPAAGLLEEVQRSVARDKTTEPLHKVALLRVKADLASARGQFKSAAKQLREAVALAEQGGGPVEVAEVRIQLSAALDHANEMTGAEKQCRLAIKALDAAEATPRIRAQAYISLASLCRRQGRHAEAAEAAELAQPLAEQAGARQQVDRVLKVKLGLAADAGELDRAADMAQQILDQRVASADRHGICHAHHALGNIERLRGRLNAAAEHHTQSLEGLERSTDPMLLAANHRDLGLTYAEAGRHDMALLHLRQSVDQYLQLGERTNASRGRSYEAAVLWASKRPVKAARIARDTMQEQVRSNDLLGIAATKHVLGLLTLDEGQPEAAREHFSEARNTFAALGVYRDLTINEAWLAVVASELGDDRTADMTARTVADDVREKPVFSRSMVRALERLVDVVSARDRDLGWRLQDRARYLEDRLNWSQS